MKKFPLLILAGFFSLSLGTASAHDGETHSDGTGPEIEAPTNVTPMSLEEEEKARKYFTDRRVVTQDGEELRFFTDVLKNRIVVMTLFYTSCTGVCPLTNQKLSVLQNMLGDSMGRDYFFVSISVDPETDTPEVLQEYAKSFDAKKGWYFLTGNKEDIGAITRRLGHLNDDVAGHNPFFMLGNVPRAHWTRLPPNQPPDAIAGRLSLIAGTFAPGPDGE